MKKVLVLLLLLSFGYYGFSQSNSEKVKNNVFKRVILIDAVPTEVLMNRNGDILAKLNVLPDYLKKFESQDSIIDISNVKIEEAPVTESNTIIASAETNSPDFISKENPELEIKFKGGTAYIDPPQIQILNNIISKLNSGLIQNVRLYGFVNEPAYRSSILSQRRMEAVLAYMKVKGVDIDTKVVVGSSVSAMNNKIVFIESK
ncbi:MAG: hypothetical protein ACM3PT_00770 [Deltaproteobacteria bacterium]